MANTILSGAPRQSNGVLLNKDTKYTKIFVGGLPYHTTDDTLKCHFLCYGEIEEAVVITDRQTGKSKGYGFVTMREEAAAERACKDPNPIIDGRKANVNLAYIGAKPRQQLGSGANGLFHTSAVPTHIPIVYQPPLGRQYITQPPATVFIPPHYQPTYLTDLRGNTTVTAPYAGAYQAHLLQHLSLPTPTGSPLISTASVQSGLPLGGYSIPYISEGITYLPNDVMNTTSLPINENAISPSHLLKPVEQAKDDFA